MKNINKQQDQIGSATIKIHVTNPLSDIEKKSYKVEYQDIGFTNSIQANYILDMYFSKGVLRYNENEYEDYVKENPSMFMLSERTDYEGYDYSENGYIWLCSGTLFDKYDEYEFYMYCDEYRVECCVSEIHINEINEILT